MNWNGQHYLEQFLPSLLATTYDNYNVIVADNASSDESISFIKSKYPMIEIIQLQKNLGFAGGYNEALKNIKADYYVLLNSDVQVTPTWLEPIISLLENNPRNAACQPKILSFKDPHIFEYAGGSGG